MKDLTFILFTILCLSPVVMMNHLNFTKHKDDVEFHNGYKYYPSERDEYILLRDPKPNDMLLYEYVAEIVKNTSRIDSNVTDCRIFVHDDKDILGLGKNGSISISSYNVRFCNPESSHILDRIVRHELLHAYYHIGHIETCPIMQESINTGELCEDMDSVYLSYLPK